MHWKNKVTTAIYLICYLIIIAITIAAFNAFWPDYARYGNYTYTIVFVCWLETLLALVLISENGGFFERYAFTQNLFLILLSIFVIYSVISIVILFITNLIYLYNPSMLYLSTIFTTVLFTLIVTWYYTRLLTDNKINNYDVAERIKRIDLISEFDKMIIKYNQSHLNFELNIDGEIKNQIDILKIRIRNVSPGKENKSTSDLDDLILNNIKKIEEYIVSDVSENEKGNFILNELLVMKETLAKRESILKLI